MIRLMSFGSSDNIISFSELSEELPEFSDDKDRLKTDLARHPVNGEWFE